MLTFMRAPVRRRRINRLQTIITLENTREAAVSLRPSGSVMPRG